jgi:hypothetical protein
MSISEADEHTIGGLLQKRREIVDQIAMKRDQIAVLAGDIEAIDHVLETLGYSGMLEAVPQLPRRVIFYRGQLREWLLAQLREHGPATSRALAERLAQVQRKDLSDKRLMNDLARHIGKMLYNLKSGRVVIASRGKKRTENVWKVALVPKHA